MFDNKFKRKEKKNGLFRCQIKISVIKDLKHSKKARKPFLPS